MRHLPPTGGSLCSQAAVVVVAVQVLFRTEEKQGAPAGERPVVHIAMVCGLNRKFYKQRNSQRPVCDMQFTVVANESNRELL